MITYLVSATHVHPEYQFTNTSVGVGFDCFDNSYYAVHSKLGCGKSCPTPEQAIRALFADHACEVTKITKG